MCAEPVAIVGIAPEGAAGLNQVAREAVERAHELWGGKRLLEMVAAGRQNTVALDKNLAERLQSLKERPPDRCVVILASGDPGFYGVAAAVLEILPPEEVVIYPQVSALQAAFARLKIPWQDAALTSAHARPLGEVIGLARRYAKLGILTDPRQNPAWIAGRLLAAGIRDCRAVVLENLGSGEEKVTDGRLSDLPHQTFQPLNVLVLIQEQGWKGAPVLAARADEAYCHKKGLITKRDMRIVTISRLGIREMDVVWDIGAGSGALSIEISEIAWRGQVFAIEMDGECLDCIRENLARFGAANVTVVPGQAPQALAGLPAPDAVVIGGSSGKLADILSQVENSARQGSRIAANFTLLENLMAASAWMKRRGWNVEISECRFSDAVAIGGGTRLAPQNPVYILSGSIGKGECG